MAGRNYGTMSQGYYYDESMTDICYNIHVDDGPGFINVAYHSKGQLIEQLVRDNYDKSRIKMQRWDTKNPGIQDIEVK